MPCECCILKIGKSQIGGDSACADVPGGAGGRPLDRPTLVRPARISLQHEHVLSAQQMQQQVSSYQQYYVFWLVVSVMLVDRLEMKGLLPNGDGSV